VTATRANVAPTPSVRSPHLFSSGCVVFCSVVLYCVAFCFVAASVRATCAPVALTPLVRPVFLLVCIVLWEGRASVTATRANVAATASVCVCVSVSVCVCACVCGREGECDGTVCACGHNTIGPSIVSVALCCVVCGSRND
jgi:hypothetical protein